MANYKLQRVKVTRQFYDKGEVRGEGSVIDLPMPTAVEMRTAHKVEFVQSDTKLSQNSNIKPPADASLPAKDGGKKEQK